MNIIVNNYLIFLNQRVWNNKMSAKEQMVEYLSDNEENSKTLVEITENLSGSEGNDKTLAEIAEYLLDNKKKSKLIYAFNGTGKTRLSIEFKKIAEKNDPEKTNFISYNAFTEDCFYWDNNIENNHKLKIRPNEDINWIFKDEGKDQEIVTNFQEYVNNKLTPNFKEDFSEVDFSLESGDDDSIENIRISKGEESNFIWSIFYILLKQIIESLNDKENNSDNKFSQLKYVFIDDPISSLDENHLIELAVNLADLIKKSKNGLKFIITTHNVTFYNVLYNELNSKECYLLNKDEKGKFSLDELEGDSNTRLSYHLHLKQKLEQAIKRKKIEKYHFTLLRNLYEKTASFLGHRRWKNLLPDDKEKYYDRIIQFTSHSTLAETQTSKSSPNETQTVERLLKHLINNHFPKEEKE